MPKHHVMKYDTRRGIRRTTAIMYVFYPSLSSSEVESATTTVTTNECGVAGAGGWKESVSRL